MRKTYLFALLAMILVVAFAGMAVAAPLTQAEQKEMIKEMQNQDRTHFFSDFSQGSRTTLDELVPLYTTTFENADDWTIIDGGDEGSGTWQCISENDNTPDILEENPPFMFVDSDNDGNGYHMIETLVSPVIDASAYSYVYLESDVYFYRYSGDDSLTVMYTTDGTNFTELESFTTSESLFPYFLNISDVAGNVSTLQIAFRYDDGDGWEYWAGIDNFTVYGSETEEDFEAPEVEITDAPVFTFEGDEGVILATATDNIGIDVIELKYGIVVNEAVPTILSMGMTATANDDEFSATIPGDFAAAGDTVAFLVEASDAAGNMTSDPATAGDAYIYKVFSLDENVSFIEIPYSFTDISGTGTEIANGDSETDWLDFTTIEGIESFDWYGETYTELTVNSNGWIAFGHETNLYSGLTIPSTSTPNKLLAALEDDWDTDETGSGRIVWELVDGKLIIQYGSETAGVYHWNKTFGPTFQIILDPSSNTATVNYMFVELMDGETPYTGDHLIGCENTTGEMGYVLYDGADYTFPTNESSYLVTPPLGGVDGVVTQGESSDLAANVTIEVLSGEEVIAQAMTGDDGVYSIMMLDGTYDVQYSKPGYVTYLEEDVVVVDAGFVTINVNLDEETTTGTLAGVIYSADTDNPIEGILVELVEAELSMTTGADGAYSFADVAIGDYNIAINAAIGLTTYHDLNAAVTITETMDPVNYSVNMIMAPENLQPTIGNMTVTLTFDPPANHAAPEMVQGRIDELELIVNLHDQNLKLVENIDEIREQLAMYRNIFENLTATSLDDIADFVGYRVKQDDDILETVYDTESIEITNLVNNQQYSFQVAADYGYGDDFLLFCDAVTATPDPGDDYWFNTTIAYEWVEIRTNDLGTRVAWTSDDVYSGMIEFASGTPFYFYGAPYSEFNIGSNGFISFTDQSAFGGFCPYSNVDIPDVDDPNGILAVHWDWTEINDEEAYSAYYYYDSENNEVIVTWYCPEWNSSPANILEYQVILDLANYNATYNYKSNTSGWPTTSTIGIENQEGTDGIQYAGTGEDEMAIMVVSPPVEIGTVSGSVVDSDDNAVGNAEVWANDMIIATTGTDGSFGPANMLAGTYDFIFVHEDYWTETVENVEITSGNETVIPVVTMTYPDPAVSTTSIEVTHNLYFDDPTTETFDLSNEGSGPMEYNVRVEFLQDVNGNFNSEQPVEVRNTPEFAKSIQSTRTNCGPVVHTSIDDIWDSITEIDDIETGGTGAADNLGVAIDDNVFYVSGFYYGTLTTFNYDGTLVGQVDYPDSFAGTTRAGLFGLAHDNNGYLYGGNEVGAIFKFAPDMSESTQIGTISSYAVTAAYDYDNNIYYASVFGDPFYAIDSAGNNTTLTGSTNSAYGMAYVPMDPDGYTIYAHVDDGTNSHIVRYNPSTDDWNDTPVATLYNTAHDDDIAGGMDAGLTNTGMYDFLTLQQGQTSDRVDHWEGYALQQWLTVDPAEGTIQSASSQQMTVTINPSADEEFSYEAGDQIVAGIVVSGPHMEDQTVVLTINFINTSAEEVDGLPTKYALHQNYPNPFNPSTEIKFDLVQAQSVKLVVFNTLGQEVARLLDAPMQAGYHVVTFDASTLASGVYFYRIETEAFTSMKKMVMVK